MVRHFGFDLAETLRDAGGQRQKGQRSTPNTSNPPSQHSPPRYPQVPGRASH